MTFRATFFHKSRIFGVTPLPSTKRTVASLIVVQRLIRPSRKEETCLRKQRSDENCLPKSDPECCPSLLSLHNNAIIGTGETSYASFCKVVFRAVFVAYANTQPPPRLQDLHHWE